MSRSSRLAPVALAAITVSAAACGRVRFTPEDASLDAPSTVDASSTLDASSTVDASSAIDAGAIDAGTIDATSALPDAVVSLDARAIDAPSALPDAAMATDAAIDAGPCPTVMLHPDRDGDGFGDPRQIRAVCVGAAGHVADASDCDDTSATSHPGGTETCNCHDDDCDGDVDELPSCSTSSHVVWARAYGGPSSDAPWMMASDGTYLHVVGQSWMGGFEVLPEERTGAGNLFEARFDARTGLGLWGRDTLAIGVGVQGGELYTLLGFTPMLEATDPTRTTLAWRRTTSGTGFYGGSYRRLAMAPDAGGAFVHMGFRAPADVGLGAVPTIGGTDTVLFRVEAGGTVRWQRSLGTSGDDNERNVCASRDGRRVAVALSAAAPLDTGAGVLDGTSPWVVAMYDGMTGAHVYSARSGSIDIAMAIAPDGALLVARADQSLEIREADGSLRETRVSPAFATALDVGADGDVYVSYAFSTPLMLGGALYTPTDGSDGLVVRYAPTWTVRWAR